jgi:hypothetical protein
VVLVLDALGEASNLARLPQGEDVLFGDIVSVKWNMVVETIADGDWVEDGVEEPRLDLVGATGVVGIYHAGV